MTYVPHHLFAMGGTLGSGQDAEIWQCTIRGSFSYTAGITTPEQKWLAAISSDFSAWFSAATSRMRNDAKATTLKLNQIGADGRYLSTSSTNAVTVNATGAVAPALPDFVMLAWSWRTARSRGPASNGRIYPPNVIGTPSGVTRASSAEVALHVTAAKALLTLLAQSRAVTGGNVAWVPGVYSNVGAGAYSDITGIRVGDVMDVQRRRKDKLKENYQSTTFP